MNEVAAAIMRPRLWNVRDPAIGISEDPTNNPSVFPLLAPPDQKDSILSISSSVELHVPLSVSISAGVAHPERANRKNLRRWWENGSFLRIPFLPNIISLCALLCVLCLCGRLEMFFVVVVFFVESGFRMGDAALNFAVQGLIWSLTKSPAAVSDILSTNLLSYKEFYGIRGWFVNVVVEDGVGVVHEL